jgi:hypothetical protein
MVERCSATHLNTTHDEKANEKEEDEAKSRIEVPGNVESIQSSLLSTHSRARDIVGAHSGHTFGGKSHGSL